MAYLPKFHMSTGHLLERFNKIIAMNYFEWAMFPHNESPLYDEWYRLWKSTKIEDLQKIGKIDLRYASEEALISLNKNKDRTIGEYFEQRRKQSLGESDGKKEI